MHLLILVYLNLFTKAESPVDHEPDLEHLPVWFQGKPEIVPYMSHWNKVLMERRKRLLVAGRFCARVLLYLLTFTSSIGYLQPSVIFPIAKFLS